MQNKFNSTKIPRRTLTDQIYSIFITAFILNAIVWKPKLGSNSGSSMYLVRIEWFVD